VPLEKEQRLVYGISLDLLQPATLLSGRHVHASTWTESQVGVTRRPSSDGRASRGKRRRRVFVNAFLEANPRPGKNGLAPTMEASERHHSRDRAVRCRPRANRARLQKTGQHGAALMATAVGRNEPSHALERQRQTSTGRRRSRARATPPPSSGASRFLTTAVEADQTRRLLCLDRPTGRILWDREVLKAPLERRHERTVTPVRLPPPMASTCGCRS
jgi:hypothetical protein